VGLDIIGPLTNTSKGNKNSYFLVWIIFIKMGGSQGYKKKTIDAKDVIQFFLKNIIFFFKT